jgi:hypothetical protein
VQYVVEPNPFPHRRPSSRGRATTAPPLPLAGDLSGRTTTTNQSLVSPIDDPHSIFTSPSHLTAGELAFAIGSKGEEPEGILVKILKVLGSAA